MDCEAGSSLVSQQSIYIQLGNTNNNREVGDLLGTGMVNDWLEKQTVSPSGLLEAQICMSQKQQDVQKKIW